MSLHENRELRILTIKLNSHGLWMDRQLLLRRNQRINEEIRNKLIGFTLSKVQDQFWMNSYIFTAH